MYLILTYYSYLMEKTCEYNIYNSFHVDEKGFYTVDCDGRSLKIPYDQILKIERID